MKIKHKLYLSMLLNVVIIITVCIASAMAIHRIHLQVDDLVKFPIPSIVRLSQMTQSFLLSVEDSLSYRVTGIPEEKQTYYTQTIEFEALLMDLKEVLGYGTPEIPPEDIPLIESLDTNWREFKIETEAYFLQKELGPDAGVTVPDARHYIEHVDGLVDTLDQYMMLEQHEIEEAHEEISEMANLVMKEIIITALIIILITSLTNILISRSIVRPLDNLKVVVEMFGRGNLSKRTKSESKDELGSLSRVFNTMADNIEKSQVTMEEKVKERTAELQSKFQEIEKLNALMTGREVKMIELKKEIENLKAQLPNKGE